MDVTETTRQPEFVLMEAMSMATEAHRGGRRKLPKRILKEGEPQSIPYINHPVEVAMCLARRGDLNYEWLAAALLHDTVEDTDLTLAIIKDRVGDAIANIVAELTDDRSLPIAERKRRELAHIPDLSPGAKRIKLADRFSNFYEMAHYNPFSWSRERLALTGRWTLEVLKHLRGIYKDIDRGVECLRQRCIEKYEMSADESPEVIQADLERYYAMLDAEEARLAAEKAAKKAKQQQQTKEKSPSRVMRSFIGSELRQKARQQQQQQQQSAVINSQTSDQNDEPDVRDDDARGSGGRGQPGGLSDGTAGSSEGDDGLHVDQTVAPVLALSTDDAGVCGGAGDGPDDVAAVLPGGPWA